MRFSKKLPRNPIKRRRYRLELGGVIPGANNQDAGDGVSNEELMAMIKGLKSDAAPPLSLDGGLDPSADVGIGLDPLPTVPPVAPVTDHQEMLNESELQAGIENTVSKIPIAKQRNSKIFLLLILLQYLSLRTHQLKMSCPLLLYQQ